jgi:voltage-gated potassium channel
MRPDLVIISRARTEASSERLVQAGATRAYNPQVNGGRRMAIFALHADVAEFLDQVMRSDDMAYNIAQVRVGSRSALAGRTLGELHVEERTGAQLLAVRRPAKGSFVPNPPTDLRLEGGMTLIVFADQEQESRVRALESGEPRVPATRPVVASPVPEPAPGPLSTSVAEPRHP